MTLAAIPQAERHIPWRERRPRVSFPETPEWPEEIPAGSLGSFKRRSPAGSESAGNGDGHDHGDGDLPPEAPAQYTCANFATTLVFSAVEAYSQPAYPEPEYHDPSVRHLRSDRVERVLNGLFRIIKRQAVLSFARTDSVTVWGLANPEDQSNRIVVTQWVRLPSEQALRYWDRLAMAINAWAKTMPEDLARIVLERMVVEVRWKRRDRTV